MNHRYRIAAIEKTLQEKFHPTHLRVIDESHLHRGHPGAKDGKGHFAITINSPCFNGKTRIEQHRMVYAALATLMQTDIHALSLTVETPSPSPT